MKVIFNRPVVFFIAILAVTTLACGLTNGSNNDASNNGEAFSSATTNDESSGPEATATTPPAAESMDASDDDASEEQAADADVAEEAAADEAAGSDAADANANNETEESETLATDVDFTVPFDGINYRVALEFSSEFTDANGVVKKSSVIATGINTFEPLASTVVFTATDDIDLGGGSNFNYTVIDGTIYSVLPGAGCAALPENGFGVNPYEMLVGAGGMFGSFEGAQRVLPNREINGREAKVYLLDEAVLNEADSQAGRVSTLEGMLYLDAETDGVLRIEISGTGYNDLLNTSQDDATLYYRLDYFDFGHNDMVEIPAGCQNALDTPWPVTEDATELAVIAGITSYFTNLTTEEVVAFYKDQLLNDGWTLTSELFAGGGATLTFGKDGMQLMLVVGPDNANPNRTSVGLIEQ